MTVRTARIPAAASVTPCRLPARVYLRRRVAAAAALVAAATGSAVLVHAASVAVADRGGVPASAAMVRAPNAFVPTATTYVVQRGDTLWGIAERFHGDLDLGWYVDELIELNGGPTVDAGQLVQLP